MTKSPRVAIVSDPLVQRGGAERVVETIAQMYPDAPIFSILYSPETGPRSLKDRIVPSALQRIPGAATRHRWLLPFYASAVEGFDLSAFDIIISSHHTAAKGVLRNSLQRHICYCHTPMRALWERPHEELATLPAPLRPFAKAAMGKLREWDYVTAGRVDAFVANSETTMRRISSHYGRFSTVINPPIDTKHFTPGGPVGDYYLVASRLVPYKRVELAVEATAKIGRKLIIVGSGSDSHKLRASHVEQYGHVSEQRLLELMRGAKALLFPGEEDFGMTPVEVMACGRPVIAYAKGGALETVIDNVTGTLVHTQTADDFAKSIIEFEKIPFSSTRIRNHAEQFSKERFVSALRDLVEDAPEDLKKSAHIRALA
ncbi:MAG: glycosyltransferase [Candidatus Eremiobacteraeota bacterium]|nr:glycosyltransferase [Candidatus Eremiobacteraeota bacterium]